MKKTLKILLMMAFVMSLLCVTAMAANTSNGFYNIGAVEKVTVSAFAGASETAITATTDKNVDADAATDTWYKDSDRIEVTYSGATSGNQYGVILVKGNTLPTADSNIYFIDQVKATSSSVEFNVYPSTISETTAMTMYISSDVKNFNLVDVSMGYAVGVADDEPTTTVVYGDVNGNGSHTLTDLTRHAKYWVDPDNVEINEANADCNGNGSHTLTDLTRHAKYWVDPDNVVLGPSNK